jgi:hypothetical protein
VDDLLLPAEERKAGDGLGEVVSQDELCGEDEKL